MKLAMAETEPLSSISLPNRAPSRNNGKNCARKVAAAVMKVCVQVASSGSPAKAAARAAAGASSSTLQPRSASHISSASPSRMPIRPMASDAFQQLVEIEGGAQAEVAAMLLQECIGGAPPFLAQHAQEAPFGVKLGGVAQRDHHVAGDAVDAHLRPLGVLGMVGLRDLAQQRDHAQLLQQHGVERDLVEAIENVAGGARRAGALDRIDLDDDGVAAVAFPH